MAAEEPEGPAEYRSWIGDWSETDKRLLLITIGGGLIVNVITVLLIGLALVIAHAENVLSRNTRVAALLSSLPFAAAIFGYVSFVLWNSSWRKRTFVLMLALAAGLLTLVFLLGLIGSAAGLR
jgi:hypothetical protein